MKIEDVKMGTSGEYAGKYISTEENAGQGIGVGIGTGVEAGSGTESGIGTGTDANDVVGNGGLPTKFGMWSKVKSFLFQEIGIGKKVVLELSPKEEKVLTEVHDFLFQEISFSGLFSLGKGKKNGKGVAGQKEEL